MLRRTKVETVGRQSLLRALAHQLVIVRLHAAAHAIHALVVVRPRHEGIVRVELYWFVSAWSRSFESVRNCFGFA